MTPQPHSKAALGSRGTKGEWRVKHEPEQAPRVVAYGLGRYSDEWRTVATMKDNSILSHEDAALIAEAVNRLRGRS